MRITEIFLSIQGETAAVGLPTIFVRTTGCNLRCTYCDTAYAFYGGESMGTGAIMDRVRSYGYRRVCLTGGEPLVQPRPQVQELLDHLHGEGYEVSIETGGAVDLSPFRLHPGQRWILDMKAPSSGESHRMDLGNLDRVRSPDEVKFVVGTAEDYRWSVDLIRRHGLEQRAGVLLGPIWGELEPRRLVEWMLADRLQGRLQLQIHKLIWDPAAQGV